MPAAIAKSVKTNTRKRFLTLAAMIRSIMVFPPQLLMSMLRAGCGEIRKRALHLRFGVDEKVRTRDHALAFRETALHFVMIADLLAQFDDPHVEFATAFIDEGDLTRTCWHDRAARNHKAFAHVHAKLAAGIHTRLQSATSTRNTEAQLRRPP